MSSMAVRLYVPWLHYSMDVTQKLNTVTKVLLPSAKKSFLYVINYFAAQQL